MLEGEAR